MSRTVNQHHAAAFDRIISPVSRDSFLSDFWGQSFLHISGEKGKFGAVLSWSELNSILEKSRISSPQLKLVRDGKDLDASRIWSDDGKLKAAAVTSALAEGATLVVNTVDDFAAMVQEVAEACEEVLQTRTTVNLYAGWRTQNGFDLHWDNQDTMILQLSGRKHWKVYQPTRLHPLKEDVEPTPKPTDEPVWDGILNDGDMLYLPRGWWHIAYPLDEASLHLTVTIMPPDGMDLLRWSADELKCHADVRRNIPHLAGEASLKQHYARLRQLIMEFWTDDAIERFLTQWEAKIPIRPQFNLPSAPRDFNVPLTMETHVRLATARRLVFLRAPDARTVVFLANGFRGNCPAEVVPALEALTATVSRSVLDLCACLPDKASIPMLQIVISALSMKGIVWLHHDRNAETEEQQ